MKIDIQLVPFPPILGSLLDHSIVVLDILRATSVIVHALSMGAKEVIPVISVEEAFEKQREFPPGTTLLGGEKDGQMIEGFDLGNSPREYVAERIKDKSVILRTTNGTRAFYLVHSGKEIMVGSFFNAEVVAERCVAQNRDLFIFPSGDEGNFSLEDSVCGGMIIDLILRMLGKGILLTDAAQAVHVLFKRFEKNLLEALQLSHLGNKLTWKGESDDLQYCAQTNIVSIVPLFKEGVIRADRLSPLPSVF
jgi:2-phosphosulfolactate phosphatase